MPLLRTPRLDLVPGAAAHLRAALEGREALAAALDAEVPESWPPEFYDADAVRYMLGQLPEDGAGDDWGFYYLVLRADEAPGAPARPTLVGAGGFKGAPDERGEVEVGYSLVPEHQHRGYATEAVLRWAAFAFGDPRVRTVVAQTLPSLGPSIRVLERAGFRFAGEGHDPHAPAGESVLRYKLTRDG